LLNLRQTDGAICVKTHHAQFETETDHLSSHCAFCGA
jgi:hypothetical protein